MHSNPTTVTPYQLIKVDIIQFELDYSKHPNYQESPTAQLWQEMSSTGWIGSGICLVTWCGVKIAAHGEHVTTGVSLCEADDL